jgi:hypothetical protein
MKFILTILQFKSACVYSNLPGRASLIQARVVLRPMVSGLFCFGVRHWVLQSSQIHLTTDSQPAGLFWYQVIIWVKQTIVLPLSRKLFSDILVLLVWGTLSDDRTGM